jgi:hypothetical protein
MFLIDLLFAFVIALLLSALLVGAAGWRHPRNPDTGAAALFLFFIFLALIWAGGTWSAPYGPTLWGAYWLPFLMIGLFLGIIILAIGTAAMPPDSGRISEGAVPEQTDAEAAAEGAAVVFGVFFWILLLGAVAAIIVAYAT